MYFGEENQFWRVKKFLYQAQDKEREAAILKRRIGMREEEDTGSLQEELSRAEKELNEVRIRITDFVARLLNPNQQMVIIKRYIDGESWEDIALEMNMSVRAVQKLHGRALPVLKELLDEEYPPETDE